MPKAAPSKFKLGAAFALAEISGNSKGEAARAVGINPTTFRKKYNLIQQYGGFDTFDDENLDPEINPRGRQPLLTDNDKERLFEHATSTKTNAEKPWKQVADELGIQASETTIKNAFYENGYGRYRQTWKTALSEEQMEEREQWGVLFISKPLDFWYFIIWSDEITVRIGERRGFHRVTRKANEPYAYQAIAHKQKQYSEFLFWACFMKGHRGPCHVWRPEPQAERQLIDQSLQAINKRLEPLARRVFDDIEHLKDLTRVGARKGKAASFANFYKPTNRFGCKPLYRNPESHGIDALRYQREIIIGKLVPFWKQMNELYPGRVWIQQDNAPPHVAWFQKDCFERLGVPLDRLFPWVPNSPDLAAIEGAWHPLRVKVTGPINKPTNRQEAEEAYERAWNEFDQGLLDRLVDQTPEKIRRMLEQSGNNHFHG
jgi:hypothetical protein